MGEALPVFKHNWTGLMHGGFLGGQVFEARLAPICPNKQLWRTVFVCKYTLPMLERNHVTAKMWPFLFTWARTR